MNVDVYLLIFSLSWIAFCIFILLYLFVAAICYNKMPHETGLWKLLVSFLKVITKPIKKIF